MPIVNKGKLTLSEVVQRQVNTDWPAANTDYDLYVQDLIASGNVIANGLIIRNIEVSDNILTGNITAASITANTLTLDIITANTFVGIDTDQVAEGTANLYYTDSRVVTAVTPLLTTANVIEEGNLYFTNARVLAALEGQDINLNDVTIYGDLTVQGNTTTLNTATLAIEDKTLLLANGSPDAATADGAGIIIDGAQANLTFNNSTDAFVTNKNFTVLGNVIVDSITANTWSGLIAGEFIEIEANGRISANINLVSNAQIAETVQTISNFTTDDLSEGTNNLYYTNSRTRSAFTAGFGITIQENGVISRTSDSELFNLDLDGSVGYVVTDSMQELIAFPATPTDSRYLLRSLHITNVSDQDTFISANVLYASGNVVHLASRIPVPEGGVLEFLKKTQVFSPGDRIHLQGYDSAGTPASGVLNAMATYQTISEDFAYVGEGAEVIQNNANVQVYFSDQSYTIFESIKLVNLEDYPIKTKLMWADANDLVKSYITYNIPVPGGSSIETLQNPKRIEKGDKIYLNHQTDGNVAVFLSGRLGEVFVIESFTSSVETGGNIDVSFQTTEEEGTLLYYSIDE